MRFWLEWDRVAMDRRDLVAKFRTYAHYVISREWFREQAGLPLLLMVTPGKEQEMRFPYIATALLADRPGLAIRTITAKYWQIVGRLPRSGIKCPRTTR